MTLLSNFIIQHSLLLADSFKQVTGQVLLEGSFTPEELAQKLYQATFVLLSHGTQPDPIFNYANQTAQQLWEMPWDDFTQLPSRLSAEPVAVAERQAMLEEAKQKGFISNYNGVRISSTSQRFIIKKAILWNIYDTNGTYQGQAATFKEWEFL
ncbi:MEKHLA domain-containing protein [Adhaeribacter radiodurans]|uniref:MEKHLA domain-containing protein n=1 Tax=Adhaeribacter radiodurans TaxID=2745197 RepID=A0A7L7LE89_9BACT|nr:MEKHLA domain-containing protein [Adhaeribacter radiodurans]QMU30845.1 MEKHLA domain-containing protein [Adhaeribacter radiodurans]